MSLTLATAARNAACNAVVDLIDAGGGAGKIEIGTAGMALLLVSCNFSSPAFDGADAGVATADTISEGTVVAPGVAAEARIRAFDDTDIITGLSVGVADSDINITNPVLSAGDKVSITSMTITMPES